MVEVATPHKVAGIFGDQLSLLTSRGSSETVSHHCACLMNRQLVVEVATAHKVNSMFGRRDPMRRYMDKITAMADELGV